MPKRKRSKEEKWRRKLKKYEDKLMRNRSRSCSSEDERDPPMTASSPLNSQRARRRSTDVSKEPTVSHSSPRFDTPPPHSVVVAPAEALRHAPVETHIDPLPDELAREVEVFPAADPELLQALGVFEAENDEWGPDIISDLAKRWEPILKDGLKKEIRDDLFKKYPFPKNCPFIKAPILNAEISAVLNESAKNRDGRLEKKQNQLGCALTILGKTMSDILIKSISTPEVLKNLSDMAKMLADSHYSETETRRSLITPIVDKAFIDSFKDRKRDSHLFGKNLGEFIKNSRGIQKTGKLIQPAAVSSTNLNSRGPTSRYQQRPTRQAHRANEMRVPQYQQYRRRAPFQQGQNYRVPPLAVAQAASGPAARPNRRQVPATTHKRKQ